MSERIPVAQVVTEKTYAGRVKFPVAVPERLAEMLQLPEDLVAHAPAMGLDQSSVEFILAVTKGKCAVTAAVDLQALAIKTGWKYPDMDRIVRGLLEKNYARLPERLDLYRLWVVVLHLKGIRFIAGRD
jgi:hypothetical protein